MQITSRFTIAIQTMLVISIYSEKRKVTSVFIAESVNSNPVIVRNILGQLKSAGLVEVKAGVGGAYLAKDAKDITLFDIFYGVEAASDNFFNFQDHPNCKCPVGQNIHIILDDHLLKIKGAMDEQMKQTTLETLLADTKSYL